MFIARLGGCVLSYKLLATLVICCAPLMLFVIVNPAGRQQAEKPGRAQKLTWSRSIEVVL
jgi:hypothetical protein